MMTATCLGLLVLAACGDGHCGTPSAAATDQRSRTEAKTTQGAAQPDAARGSPPKIWPERKYLTIDEVHARVQARDVEMLLVNVVDPEFYDLGFIPGSVRIPWNTLADRLTDLDRKRHVVIYCRRGVRSESAYVTLKKNGYPRVWIMEGGIERWGASGYPVVPK